MERPAEGRIHSFQSLGAADGPGLRYVVFMQGCPLRCVYCHNPDTWDPAGGQAYTAAEVVERLRRYRGYFGRKGGVTVSGGEPLMQPEFVGELFRRCREEGIHTALDTSGNGNLQRAETVLEYTDLILLDIKFLTQRDYEEKCRGSLEQAERFRRMAEGRNIPIWARHVVVPGLTDGREHIRALREYLKEWRTLEKVELLPFRKLCLEKYRDMGIPFPLENTPEMDEQALAGLA